MDLLQYLSAAAAELQSFLDNTIAHAPTLRATALLAVILGVLALLSTALAAILDHVRAGRPEPLSLSVVPESGEDRVVRLTRDRRERLGLRDGDRVVVTVAGEGSCVAQCQTRRKVGAFSDDHAAISMSALRQLGLSEAVAGDGSAVTVEPLAWYSPHGVVYRTIFDPNLSVSLTWIVTLVSIAVSLAVSEFYYQRALSNAATASSLRPAIHEAASTAP
ncbi:MAG: hypothetical protein ACKVRO_03225 [Micropepsaceae bacterium]